MKTIASQIALVLAVYFFVSPLQACQPELFQDYVQELPDGKHVFAMRSSPRKSYGEEIGYPLSGVYLKGEDKELVWRWEGGYIRWGVLENSISRNGRYLVHAHQRYGNEHDWLSIYDSGDRVHVFGMETFLDDFTQVREVPCRNPRWINGWDYDTSLNHLKIETTAGRVLLIDVSSSEILSVENIRRMQVNGVVRMKNGENQPIHDIGNCGGISSYLGGQYLRKEDGLTDVPTFIGQEILNEKTEDDGSVITVMNFVMVPMDQVQRLVPIKEEGKQSFSIKAELSDGGIRTWTVDPAFWSLCGRDRDGDALSIEIEEFEWLIITSPKSGV